MKMKALTTVWYAGREYSAGETITPECALDGETLRIMGQAEEVAEVAPYVETRTGHEAQGIGYDSGATGYELQGRRTKAQEDQIK